MTLTNFQYRKVDTNELHLHKKFSNTITYFRNPQLFYVSKIVDKSPLPLDLMTEDQLRADLKIILPVYYKIAEVLNELSPSYDEVVDKYLEFT